MNDCKMLRSNSIIVVYSIDAALVVHATRTLATTHVSVTRVHVRVAFFQQESSRDVLSCQRVAHVPLVPKQTKDDHFTELHAV